MGKVKKVSCLCNHCSELRIETEDIADISLEHEDGRLSHIHLNYLERGYEWVTRVLGTSGSALWDYGRGHVEWKRIDGSIEQKEVPSHLDRDSLFCDQLRHWLHVLNGTAVPYPDLTDGITVTEVALAAKRSSIEKRHIEL